MTLENPVQKAAEYNPRLEAILSKKLPHGAITSENISQFTFLRNGLQLLLALREVQFITSDTEDMNIIIDHWKEYHDHAKKFEQVFEEIIKEDPRYFDSYNSLKEIPEIILIDIENRLNQ